MPICLKFSIPNVVGEISHETALIGAASKVQRGSQAKKNGRAEVEIETTRFNEILRAVTQEVPLAMAARGIVLSPRTELVMIVAGPLEILLLKNGVAVA